MVFFSFLHSRQNQLIEQLQEKSSKLSELLTSASTPSLTRQNVFPDHVLPANPVQPPAPQTKAS
jgi:hypothetical protein